MIKSIVHMAAAFCLGFALVALVSNCKKDNFEKAASLDPALESDHQHVHGERCGHSGFLASTLKKHPEMAARMAKTEEFVQRELASPSVDQRAVITIPVVFHVVWNTPAQNVSDAQIMAQLEVMNKDFRRLNADKVNTPAAFQSIAADAEFEFCLAKRDPQGNPTTGIVRRQTSVTEFLYEGNDEMYFTAQGGSDIWNRDKYLNIHVINVDMAGAAAGPGWDAATDGVYIDYTCFGVGGSAQAPYHLGRTATHEIGHWLGLAHIWGPGAPNVANCNDTDGVADTPNQSKSNAGCPAFPKANCGNQTNGEMFMNYMDYVDDPCYNLFSTGQKSRMRAHFNVGGARAALLNSDACVPPSGCGIVSQPTASGVSDIAATINWPALAGATSYNLQYKTAAATAWTTVSGITTTSKSIAGLTASTAYQAKVQAVCGAGTGAFSSVLSFSTTAAPTGCTDVFESNNTSATAKTFALATNLTAQIPTTTDQDWFRFTNTTAQRNIKVTLTNLPADYDVYLFRNGVQVAASENPDQQDETIVLNNATVGTYRFQIIGYDGAVSPNCYTFRAERSATIFNVSAPPTNGLKAKKKAE